MVEEKKKRGRPKKNVESVTDKVTSKKESVINEKTGVWDWEISGNQRRDDLVVAMIMAVLNKQGNIKWDFALDLFDTGTKLAYQFGWLEKPKEKKQTEAINPVLDPAYGVVTDAAGNVTPVQSLANTPADIWAAMHNK